METFLLAFIPLFVAIDPIGTLPLFLGLTEGYSRHEKKVLAGQAVVTALVIGLIFGAAGHYIFSLLGITSSDFKIAGGLLLLIFSVREIFGNTPKLTEGPTRDNMIGIVPIGIPLIAGPAMITTLLILQDMHQFPIVISALLANLIITFTLFVYSDRIIHKTGEAFGKAAAKVVAIFLAAIGIMMIRKGLESFFLR